VTGPRRTLRFGAVGGKTYTLQFRDSLGAGSWLKLADVPAPAVTGTLEVVDPNAGSSTRFYRIVTPTQP